MRVEAALDGVHIGAPTRPSPPQVGHDPTCRRVARDAHERLLLVSAAAADAGPNWSFMGICVLQRFLVFLLAWALLGR